MSPHNVMSVTPLSDREPSAKQSVNIFPSGLVGLAIHASVSLVIGTYVFVLVLFHDLGQDVALGLFGTIVGAHVTAAAGAQLHHRQSDNKPQ